MENETEVASFGGQVKTCGDNRLTQWKTGIVRIYRREDGVLRARMFLHVSPSRVVSQVNVLPTDLSVKSNRVIVTDAKGAGFYVRLNGSKEAEDARNIISRLSSYESSKRSKAEVGLSTSSYIKINGNSDIHTENNYNMNNSLRMKMSPSVKTPQRMNIYSQKRRSIEMDEKYRGNDKNSGEPAEKKSTFTNVKDSGYKAPRLSNSSDVDSFKGLTSGSFYGKNTPKGYGIKEPSRHSFTSVSKSYRPGLQPSQGETMEMSENSAPRDKGSSTTSSTWIQNNDVSSTEHGYFGTDPSQSNRNTSDSSIVGFDNLGNTCFINSPLQCLSSLEPLSLDIQAVVQQYGHSLKTESVTGLFYLLMKNVRNHSLNGVKIKTILKVLRETLFGKFAVNTQQDAHELLSEILDRIHEEIQDLKRQLEEDEDDAASAEREEKELKKGKPNRMEKKIRERLSRYILSPTEKNFTWFFKNSFHYHDCKRQVWSQEEHDTTLMLAFSSKTHLHLQDCVDEYFKSCDVELKCEQCDKNESATITRKIIRRPRCLILNLLRYQTDSLESKKKLDSISIPRYISIGDFCSEDVKDPLYIDPVFMSEKACQDESEEMLITLLQDAQEELKTENSDQNQTNPPTPEDTREVSSNREMDDANGQIDISLPGMTSNSGRPPRNSPVGKEEGLADDVQGRRKGSPEKMKRKSPLHEHFCSPEKTKEAEPVESNTLILDPLKKRKLEERLKCRGGSANELAQDEPRFVGDGKGDECVTDGHEEESGSSMKEISVCSGDTTFDTTEQSNCKVDMDEDISQGYEGGSEGDSSSIKIDVVSSSVILKNGCNNNDVEANNLNITKKHNSSRNESYSGDSVARNNNYLAPINEEQVSETEDIDNQILCGKRICEFSESELQALDINLFNDSEMLLYAQAVSRLEYVKENELELNAVQMAYSVLDDFSDDCNSLECEPSVDGERRLSGDSNFPGGTDSSGERVQDLQNLSLKVETSLSSISNESGCSRTVGRSKNKLRAAKETCLDQVTSSDTEGLSNERESGFMSPPTSSKVPDMYETSIDISFRGEASLHDESINGIEGTGKDKLSTSLGQNVSKLPNSQTRFEHCIFCSAPISDGQCTKCDSGRGDFSCVPTDDHFSVEDEKMSEDAFTADELPSKSGVLSDKGNANMEFQSPIKTFKSHFFPDGGGKNAWMNAGGLVSASMKSDRDIKLLASDSAFQKPKQDMFMASPSKTKNLVKTRDYSRLKSPIASPRKKTGKVSPPKKTAGANKQLIFPENEKVSEKPTDKSLKSLSTSDSTDKFVIGPGNSKNTDVESIISSVVDSSSDTVDKSNESDSSYQMAQGDDSQSHRTSKLQAINTSTPITSTQESYTKNFQQPLHISVTHAASTHHSSDSVKSMTSLSVCTSPSQQRPQIVPGSSEGPVRSKASRSLSVSFAAAEEKENTGDSCEEKQSRRKRLSYIESGDSDCSYRLVGIVNHHGESLFAGHYTSYSFNLRKQKWFYLDDKHTRETLESTVRRESTCNGYVFFYMDKNLFDSYSSMKDETVTVNNRQMK